MFAWIANWLRKVAGPKTTALGSSRAIAAQARRRGLAADHPPAGRLARQAALQRQQPPEVVGAQELAQVALDQDLDRLVPELLVEALGRGVGAGATVDQRVRAAVGLEAQRGDRPDQGQQDRRHDHRRRPLDGPPGNPCQQVPHPQSQVRERPERGCRSRWIAGASDEVAGAACGPAEQVVDPSLATRTSEAEAAPD